MKKTLLVLSFFTTFAINTAMAEMNKEPPTARKNKSGLMTAFKLTSPMPLLMPVIVKNADKLGLSEEQKAVFTQWRVEKMGISLKNANAIIAEEEAIIQAALDGKPNVEIEKMMSSILEKRQFIASNMLKCRDLIINTLDTTQWQKLVAIYTNKS